MITFDGTRMPIVVRKDGKIVGHIRKRQSIGVTFWYQPMGSNPEPSTIGTMNECKREVQRLLA